MQSCSELQDLAFAPSSFFPSPSKMLPMEHVVEEVIMAVVEADGSAALKRLGQDGVECAAKVKSC